MKENSENRPYRCREMQMTPYLLNEALSVETHNLKRLTCQANAVGANQVTSTYRNPRCACAARVNYCNNGR